MSTHSRPTPEYPPKAAGRHLTTAVPTVPAGITVADAIRSVTDRTNRWESLTYVYILDHAGHLVGACSLRELFGHDPAAPIDACMTAPLVTAHPHSHREHVAQQAIAHELAAIPIVDRSGKFLGIMDTDAILATLHEEHVEDFLHLAGIRRLHPLTDILTTPLGALVRARFPWLLVGLLVSMVMTLTVRSFEHALTAEVALAFFIPLIAYMADALGTQTQTLYIRALAVRDAPFGRYLVRELATSAVISVTSAALLYGFATLFHAPRIALAVSLALLVAMSLAPTLALSITTLIARSGRDPALGGGPLATAVQDLLSISIYFVIASLIL